MSAELEIRLFACPDGEDSLRWLVDISVNEQTSQGPTTLRHPFNQNQRNDCRWYVEEFVCKSPYSVTRARNAASSLRQYSKSLLDQLGLVKLVMNDFASHSCDNRSIAILISENEGAKHSVHQLHWELLEDPSFWDMEVQVTVKRIVNGNLRAVLRDVALDEEQNSDLPRVNGLLVVARDLSQDLNRYDDVSPHLALGILAQIQTDLQRIKSQACLHLEVVRPGSLEALEKHLKRATQIHGKNYYHFVHFDLHGIVKSREGAGYLLFNDPGPDVHTTVQQNAKAVADILAQHGVAVAVLNACESARANCGDAANIAKTLARSGVQNILAMSFRICSSAAELVLRAFYHSLFLEGNTFSHAARRAREVLRLHPERQARLNLKRSLTDYFVPVVYSCGEDSRLAPVTSQGLQYTYEFALRTAPFAGKEERQLIGREFDLLRLEKKLLAQRGVHLTGRAGVGKTALLRHACGIWQQTSFVDIVLFVDFTKVSSLADAVGSLVSQIPLSMLARVTLKQKLEAMITSPTFDSAMFDEALLEACSKSRLMIIFDGLYVFHANEWPPMVFSAPWNEAVPMLSRFMEALLHLGDAGTQHYHIVVSRSHVMPLPFSEVIKKRLSLEENLFRVPSLRLSDSIELSLLALREAGLNVDNWVDADLNELELLLGLLDGNPSAILHVLPLMSETGVSIREFRSLVQHGILPESFAGHAEDMFEEIYNAFYAFCDMPLDFLLLLSTAWHESMGISCLIHWTASHNICTDELSLSVFAIVLGKCLIDVRLGTSSLDLEFNGGGEDVVVSWIHPLVTICGRRIAYEIFTGRQNQSAAAALVLTTLEVQFDKTKLSEQTQVLCADFTVWFLKSLATFDLSRELWLRVFGYSYDDLHATWSLAAGNLATCLSILTRRPDLPIDQWLLDYVSGYMSRILLVGSVAQVADYAKSFEQLFETFINLNGSLAIPPLQQQYALETVSCLTNMYKQLDPAKYRKYMHMGLRIVQESEERFGTFEDSWVRFWKGELLRDHAKYLLAFGPREQAVEVWKTMLDNDKSLFENPHSLGYQWSPEQIQALSNKFSTNETDAEAITKRLSSLAVNSGLEALYNSRKNSLHATRAVAYALDRSVPFGLHEALPTRKFQAILARKGEEMEVIWKASEAMGIRGIPESLFPKDMHHFMSRFDSLEGKIAGLEIAESTANSAEAGTSLGMLLWEALENLELDELEEYFNAFKRHAKNFPFQEGYLFESEKLKDEITLFTTTMGILLGNSTKAIDEMGHRDELVSAEIEKAIRMLKERNAPQEAFEVLEVLRDIFLKAPIQQTDEIDREQLLKSWQRCLRVYFDNMEDQEFMQKLPKLHLQYLQHIQRFQDARLKQDPKLALERLEVLEKFLHQPGNETFHEFVGKDVDISKLRLDCEYVDAIFRLDVEEALRIVRTSGNDLSSELRQHATQWIAEFDEMLLGLTKLLQWDFIY